jgi:hypothetical protein
MRITVDLSNCKNKVELMDLVNLTGLDPNQIRMSAFRKLNELHHLGVELRESQKDLDKESFEQAERILSMEWAKADRIAKLVVAAYGERQSSGGPTSVAGIRRLINREKRIKVKGGERQELDEDVRAGLEIAELMFKDRD